jgi:outer membrane protein OmpA-like peptidoglycan-associated protein
VERTHWSFRRLGAAALALIPMTVLLAGAAFADDCKRVQNILVLFDASGYMNEKGRLTKMVGRMAAFKDAIPLTADGFFNVGVRHYGLKVGLGCNNTESVASMQPWDPERFMNSFPTAVSYGMSSLSAGLRAAGDDAAEAEGKTIILVIGGGIESCKGDPVKTADRLAFNNPDLEIHTFQMGGSDEGRFNLEGIAAKGRGTFTTAEQLSSPAGWHAWMKRFLVVACAPPAPQPGPAPQTQAQVYPPVLFDYNSFSIRSKEPAIDGANAASIEAVGRKLQSNPVSRLVIHGFADGKGNPQANEKIAQRRAEAVKRLISTNYGVVSGRITIVPRGPAPGLPPGAPEGRRVEFEIIE